MFQIRLHSPFRQEFVIDRFIFSNNVSPDDADALLCEWQPHHELLTFEGPKALYNSEALSRRMFRDQPEWQFLFAKPHSDLFLHHAHPNPELRVPMIAFVEPMVRIHSDDRLGRGIAIISNAGTTWRTEEITIRNQFATHPLVDLYGSKSSWARYMRQNNLSGELPLNYKREIAWPWNSMDKFETMAQYRAAICLENIIEPYYFTEKFYAAAQAACIPIYHAHPTVRNTTLKHAMWVDPADFSFDAEKTLTFALSENWQTYAAINSSWLDSLEAKNAGLQKVFRKLGEILTRNINKQ